MKKMHFLGLLAFVALLTSCGKSAVDFNNKLVTYQKELDTKYNTFSAVALTEAGDTISPSTLSKADSLISFTEGKIKEINAMSVPSGGEKLQKVFLRQFAHVVEEIKSFKAMNDMKLSEADRAKAAQFIQDSQKTAQSIGDELIQEQKNFAADKGFKIK
jgi:hypothetical protein